MNKVLKFVAIICAALAITACGESVQVPPAHVGKIMGRDGYQPNLIPTSQFRLPFCLTYCDKLVLLDVSDKSNFENLSIFIPEDKLNLEVQIRTTLSVSPKRTEELFGSRTPKQETNSVYRIDGDDIYRTYAAQIIQTEAREYLSTMSISEIASSNEKVNADLRERISKSLRERTPFDVRYVGLTSIKYPKIITDAQEAAAERREAIQTEESQLKIAKIRLSRELEEARMRRAIEIEKAETEAAAQRKLAESVDPRVLELRKLEIQKIQAERWNGVLPATVLGENVPMMVMQK